MDDLSDPAVKRRVCMLRTGGADVVLRWFFIHSTDKSHKDSFLGYSKDGTFLQRIMLVLKNCLSEGNRSQCTDSEES